MPKIRDLSDIDKNAKKLKVEKRELEQKIKDAVEHRKNPFFAS